MNNNYSIEVFPKKICLNGVDYKMKLKYVSFPFKTFWKSKVFKQKRFNIEKEWPRKGLKVAKKKAAWRSGQEGSGNLDYSEWINLNYKLL